jgi:hypothetical protein
VDLCPSGAPHEIGGGGGGGGGGVKVPISVKSPNDQHGRLRPPPTDFPFGQEQSLADTVHSPQASSNIISKHHQPAPSSTSLSPIYPTTTTHPTSIPQQWSLASVFVSGYRISISQSAPPHSHSKPQSSIHGTTSSTLHSRNNRRRWRC